MDKNTKVEKLREEINQKRDELNKILTEGSDRDRILEFSQELDQLISKYYTLGSMG